MHTISKKGVFFMDNLEKLIKELKSMDKSSRKKLVDSVSRDPDTMSKLKGLLEDESIQKKLKDILG